MKNIMMKFFGIFILLTICMGNLATAKGQKSYGIIPQPEIVKAREGFFVLNSEMVILAPGKSEAKIARYFNGLIGPATGFHPEIKSKTDREKNIFILKLTNKISEEEGYELFVRPGAITLKARTEAGLFYGIQTLRQMLPKQIETQFPYNNITWKIAAVDIVDAPRFSYRGMHLDVARSFFPVKFIKKYIDLIAFHKMNKFHWHLTDNQGWRIEIKKYPRLTEIGAVRRDTVVGHTTDKDPLYDEREHKGFYTQTEIRDVVKYAADRQIEVIPEIDIPGHATAMIVAYPKLSCRSDQEAAEVTRRYGIFLEILCPTDYTFNFLDNVFKEVAELFPTQYIHIGGDEVLKNRWQDCEICQVLMKKEGLKDLSELQSYFIRRVEKIVSKYDRKIIGWDEILEGGINPSATIMSWTGMEGGIEAAKHGHEVIMTPGSHVYFDQYQSLSLDEPMSIHDFTDLEEVYHFNPVPDELTNDEKKFIKGAQGNVWTEYIHSARRVEHAILPRMSALAEVVWSAEKNHNWNSFIARLGPLFSRFDQMDLNAARSIYKPVAKGELLVDNRMKITLSVSGGDMIIRYTLDGTKPTMMSPVYDKPLVLDHSATVRAVGQNRITGGIYGDTRLSFSHHKALGKKMTFRNMPTALNHDRPEKLLLNGLLGRDRIFQVYEWSFMSGEDFDGVIDLEEITEVQEVSMGVQPGQYRQFYPPKSFQVELSNDNKNWRKVGAMTAGEVARAGSILTISLSPVKARYIRIIAAKYGDVFSAQYQKMKSVSLYIDEITVR